MVKQTNGDRHNGKMLGIWMREESHASLTRAAHAEHRTKSMIVRLALEQCCQRQNHPWE